MRVLRSICSNCFIAIAQYACRQLVTTYVALKVGNSVTFLYFSKKKKKKDIIIIIIIINKARSNIVGTQFRKCILNA